MEDMVNPSDEAEYHPTFVLTGGTSFTGFHFAEALLRSGWRVILPLRGARDEYLGIRNRRLQILESQSGVEIFAQHPMGSQELLGLVSGREIAAVGLHHAVVGQYRAVDFDVPGAVAEATKGGREFLAAVLAAGVSGVVLTHSIFESGMGVGDDPRPIGLYAVAKRTVNEVWSEWSRQLGLAVQHFTIANPVGPLEDPRLISYLVKSWRTGGVPRLKAPHYIRDNVACPVLAQSYLNVAREAANGASGSVTPSMWAETNMDFSQRVAREFGLRWDMDLRVGAEEEISSDEPITRIGRDRVDFSDGDEQSRFWDSYAEYYRFSV